MTSPDDTPPVLTETRVEWRVCGHRTNYGPWEGPWRKSEMTAIHVYDAKQMAKNNDEVWLEQRTVTVTTSATERIELCDV